MKKLLFGLVLFALPFAASAATFDTNISYGSTGPDVSALQEFLVTQHLLDPQFVTGNFYSLTLGAVKAFQTAESITPVSGFVGPITRGTINTLLSSQISDSEESAATTTEPVDLSQMAPPVTQTFISSPVTHATSPVLNVAPIQSTSCVPHPILTMQTPAPTWLEAEAIGYYSTGCPLDIPSLEKNYVFTAQINNQSPASPGGSQLFDVEDNASTLRFLSSELYPAGATIVFTLTMGSTTTSATTVIPPSCDAVQIATLTNQITQLRQTASSQEASAGAQGMASTAQGRAQQIATDEMQQEIPLLAQIQALKTNCIQ